MKMRLLAGVFGMVLAAAAARAEVKAPSSGKVIEVAFAVDATGSMSNLIEGAKRKIWSIATTIADANPDAELRIALVAYRDVGDEFVTKSFDLTPDIQAIYGHLLSLKAAGGGDWPESVNEALDNTVTKLSWTQGPAAQRIIFLVGDAPPHMDYKQDRKYPEIVADAVSRGIIINAVQAGGARDTERVWREIAQRASGKYIPIPQDGGKVVVIETPYDEEIIILQERINGTIIPYGDQKRRDFIRQKAEQVRAAPKSSASDLAGYINRKSGKAEAVTGEGDLVADIKQGRSRLDTVKDEDLPEKMRGMSQEQRKSYVSEQETRRAEFTRQMSELVAKREAFTASKRAEMAKAEPGKARDAFDEVVSETLRKQIRK